MGFFNLLHVFIHLPNFLVIYIILFQSRFLWLFGNVGNNHNSTLNEIKQVTTLNIPYNPNFG